MFGIVNYSMFIISGILLNLTPGSDTMYILGRGMQGKKEGIVSALGISAGCIVHTLMAGLGLSVILAKSAFAFNLIKYIGAAYLIYLGIKSILSRSSLDLSKENMKQTGLRKIFISGMLTNVLNPKVALFFLAFLPQFIDSSNIYGALPFLLLGFTFVFTGTIWCLILAFVSALATRKLREDDRIEKIMNKITGFIFIGLGIKLIRTKQ